MTARMTGMFIMMNESSIRPGWALQTLVIRAENSLDEAFALAKELVVSMVQLANIFSLGFFLYSTTEASLHFFTYVILNIICRLLN